MAEGNVWTFIKYATKRIQEMGATPFPPQPNPYDYAYLLLNQMEDLENEN